MNSHRLAAELRKIFPGDRIITGELERRIYNYDSSFMARFHNFMPDAVVLPRSTAEVSATLRLASEHKIPVVPRGAGSGETCGCLAVRGGIVLDLSSWDTVEEVDVANMQVIARPGWSIINSTNTCLNMDYSSRRIPEYPDVHHRRHGSKQFQRLTGSKVWYN